MPRFLSHSHGGIGLEEIGHAPLNRSRTGCDRTSSAASGLNDLFISVGADEWFFGDANGSVMTVVEFQSMKGGNQSTFYLNERTQSTL